MADDELDIEVEIDPVFEWRCKQLELLGIERFPAFRLAMSGADWHAIEKAWYGGASEEALLEMFL